MIYYTNISDLKQDIDLLEYNYEGYDSVYFNLIGSYTYEENVGGMSEYASVSVKDSYWVSTGYDSNIFKSFQYVGLDSATELLNYLNSVIK